MNLISRIACQSWGKLYASAFLVLCFGESVQASVLANQCDQAIVLPRLQASINRTLEQPHLTRTRWGLDIRQISKDGKNVSPLYSRNSSQLFLPASTAKLFTSVALALDFDASYQIKTHFFAMGESSTLQELKIVGVGDPTILDPQFREISQNLQLQGVTKIERLVGDSRAFVSPAIVPSWEWGDLQTSDGVPITSLSFSQNSLPLRLSPTKMNRPLQFEWLDGEIHPRLPIENLSLTVAPEDPEFIALGRSLLGDRLTIRGQLRDGASPDISYVAIANPTAYFLHRLNLILKTQGISVNQLVVQDSPGDQTSSPAGEIEATQFSGAILSAPLSDLLKEVNQSSNNFYTESLLRHWAWAKKSATSSSASVTLDESLERLEEVLEPLGIDPDAYRLKDASGLSRQNLVSPESLTSTVMAITNWQRTEPLKFKLLKDSLAVSGEAGTLKRRFQNTPVVGKLFGKTGTLSGTVTLAGFLLQPGQPTIVLSIMANHSDQSSTTLRRAIDDIVLELYQAQSCYQNSAD